MGAGRGCGAACPRTPVVGVGGGQVAGWASSALPRLQPRPPRNPRGGSGERQLLAARRPTPGGVSSSCAPRAGAIAEGASLPRLLWSPLAVGLGVKDGPQPGQRRVGSGEMP